MPSRQDRSCLPPELYLIFGMSLAKMDSMVMDDKQTFTAHKYPNIKVISFLCSGADDAGCVVS